MLYTSQELKNAVSICNGTLVDGRPSIDVLSREGAYLSVIRDSIMTVDGSSRTLSNSFVICESRRILFALWNSFDSVERARCLRFVSNTQLMAHSRVLYK